MTRRSKRYRKEAEGLSREPLPLAEAVAKVKSFDSAKFDQSVECVVNLGIDPKQADQLIRGSLSLPHGIGKQKKVIAFCEDSDIEAAKAAGMHPIAITNSYRADELNPSEKIIDNLRELTLEELHKICK